VTMPNRRADALLVAPGLCPVQISKHLLTIR
jgi:hypothetical protein